MDAQLGHFLAFAAQTLGQAAGGAAGVFGGFVQAVGFLRQGFAQQGHVVARPFGGQRRVVDVGTQRMQNLAGLAGGQGGGGDQGFGQITCALGFGGQTCALAHGMGQHDGQTRWGQRDQGVDGDAKTIQFRPACAELIGGPGCDAADPQGRGDPGDQIGVTARRHVLALGGGRLDGGRGGFLDRSGRGACGHRHFDGDVRRSR